MKIYTYHEPVDNLPYQHTLLPLWHDRWSSLGWEPVLLTYEQAQPHPLHDALAEHFSHHLPTVNPPKYERACYMRWLAMAMVGGGWMSDADVIPYSLLPFEPCHNTLTIFSSGLLSPHLVHGSASEYERIVREVFLKHKGGVYAENHASDQDILQKHQQEVRQFELVAEYNTEGWRRFPAVHYNNDSMGFAQPRSEFIPKLR